ncbi:MAG: chemotaxis protein CheW [Candidatus Hydrogenedentes bacterium]|nr:chemotaxis protein CheW [Candidatus Hydrogenedentota bacterium]
MHQDEASDGMLVTGFRLGEAAFGVDARLVQEVVKVGEITRVHDAPPGVVGIRNLRGRIVTVVDMASHLDLGDVEEGPDTRLLIMEHQGESYGFLVDAVTDAIALDEGLVGAAPASLDPALRNRLRGVWREGDRLTAILDPRALFQWDDAAK